MKTCVGCKYAVWKRTKIGKLHPSRAGRCIYPYVVPVLPNSMYWLGTRLEAPHPSGGYIFREKEFEKQSFDKECVYRNDKHLEERETV